VAAGPGVATAAEGPGQAGADAATATAGPAEAGGATAAAETNPNFSWITLEQVVVEKGDRDRVKKIPKSVERPRPTP
jgi:hypothetical protein